VYLKTARMTFMLEVRIVRSYGVSMQSYMMRFP
jgi:hypothetical protein